MRLVFRCNHRTIECMNEALLPQMPHDYAVMYVDMNAFFASVEQQEHPELRDRPVAVAPYTAPSCTIVAASYEARAYGIGVGTKIQQAIELCPGLTVVRDNPAAYRRYHERIMAILRDTYCRIGVRSIDEAYLVIPTYARTRGSIIALIEAITTRFRAELGEYIKCSIGVGPNIWLAKMAAESNKPNGRTLLVMSSLPGFYAELPLTRCTGIGRRMARRLYDLGISNTTNLSVRPLSFMRSHLGVMGEKWYLRLRGYEVDLDPRRRQRQSVSHQVTVVGDRNLDLQQCRSYVRALAARLAVRLRSYSLYANGAGLYVSFTDGSAEHVHASAQPLAGDTGLAATALGLLDRIALKDREVRLFALYLDGLNAVCQPSLPFTETLNDARDQTLSVTIDTLNQRFGSKTVMRASGLGSSLAPDRIGFGHL